MKGLASVRWLAVVVLVLLAWVAQTDGHWMAAMWLLILALVVKP